jgi:hypothetical protein
MVRLMSVLKKVVGGWFDCFVILMFMVWVMLPDFESSKAGEWKGDTGIDHPDEA